MSQLTIKLSDKADALIAQLQKEIFNRRRKKVTPAGVIETLVESGAKSQSDKRFATSWKNLIADIEKAASIANAHGAKPSSLSDSEWVMVLAHRARAAAVSSAGRKPGRAAAAKRPATKSAAKPAAKSAAKPAAKPATRSAAKPAATRATTSRTRPAKTARSASGSSSAGSAVTPTTRVTRGAAAPVPRTSVAKRMAKAAASRSRSRSSTPAAALQALNNNGTSSNGTAATTVSGS